ncbi:MAG: FeoA family protein [Bacteroidota bacterium]|jgi:Fe2+ transport system protein FeoA
MNDVTLNVLQPGERGIIKQLNSSVPQVRQRLLELGMTKGTPVELIRVAPMGDPIEVKIKGYRLSLRRLEAEAVVVRRGS